MLRSQSIHNNEQKNNNNIKQVYGPCRNTICTILTLPHMTLQQEPLEISDVPGNYLL